MNISLTPELEEFVNCKVQSGLYNSVSEVIREALRLLVAQDTEQKAKLESLGYAIQDGVKSGESIPWDLNFFLAQIKNKSES